MPSYEKNLKVNIRLDGEDKFIVQIDEPESGESRIFKDFKLEDANALFSEKVAEELYSWLEVLQEERDDEKCCNKDENFAVLWIDDSPDSKDRNDAGMPINGFLASTFATFNEAYEQAKHDLDIVEKGREVIVTDYQDFLSYDDSEPLPVLWTNQPERYPEPEQER